VTSIMSRNAKPAHKSAARVLGYALTAGDFETWNAASAAWEARLTAQERAALAYMTLKSLDYDDAIDVVDAVFPPAHGRAAA